MNTNELLKSAKSTAKTFHDEFPGEEISQRWMDEAYEIEGIDLDQREEWEGMVRAELRRLTPAAYATVLNHASGAVLWSGEGDGRRVLSALEEAAETPEDGWGEDVVVRETWWDANGRRDARELLARGRGVAVSAACKRMKRALRELWEWIKDASNQGGV